MIERVEIDIAFAEVLDGEIDLGSNMTPGRISMSRLLRKTVDNGKHMRFPNLQVDSFQYMPDWAPGIVIQANCREKEDLKSASVYNVRVVNGEAALDVDYRNSGRLVGGKVDILTNEVPLTTHSLREDADVDAARKFIADLAAQCIFGSNNTVPPAPNLQSTCPTSIADQF